MKKQTSLFLMLCFSILKLSAQTWAPCAAGVGDPVNCMEVYSGNLYITNYTNPNPGDIDRWNGTTMTNVYNSIYQYGDLAASGSTIYTTGLSTGQGLYNSPTGNVGTWTQVGTSLGGPFQLCWFNSQLYRSNMSAASVQRLVGTTWTNVPLTYASAVGTPEIKTQGSLLYLGGRWNLGATYYGFTTINTSNVQAAYGPTITSGQTVTDFVFNGSDLYVNISGTGGGFFRQNGSSWTTIFGGVVQPGRCESYGGKLYFSAYVGGTYNIYSYDPSAVISGTNPVSIATITAGGVTDMAVYNNSLYIGGSFTSVNTVSSGVVAANNIIRFSVPFPASSFTTTPLSLCGLGTMSTTNTSTGAIAYQWYVNGTPYSTSTNTTVNAWTYTSPNPFSAGTFSVTLTAINGPLRDSVTQVVNTLANPLPPNFSMPGVDTACGGAAIYCTATGVSYQWSTGATTTSNSLTLTGPLGYSLYTVSAVGANGCITPSSDTAEVFIHPLPTPTITQIGNMLTTGTYSTYQWGTIGFPIAGETNQNFFPTSSNAYYVQVVDSNGCPGQAGPFNFVLTSISEASQVESPKILQSGNNLTVTFSKSQPLVIYDALGKLYYTGKEQEHIIVLTPGIYFIRAEKYVGKVVVP